MAKLNEGETEQSHGKTGQARIAHKQMAGTWAFLFFIDDSPTGWHYNALRKRCNFVRQTCSSDKAGERTLTQRAGPAKRRKPFPGKLEQQLQAELDLPAR